MNAKLLTGVVHAIAARNPKVAKSHIRRTLQLHAAWLKNPATGHRANMMGWQLNGINLSGVDFRGMHFSRVDMHGTLFVDADLSESNMYGVNLSYAQLVGTNLQHTNLRYANLYGANLYVANLHGANLLQADLRGANIDYSCLPLWCGGQFQVDDRIAKQLCAHVLRILELSNCKVPVLKRNLLAYCKGWHREREFKSGSLTLLRDNDQF